MWMLETLVSSNDGFLMVNFSQLKMTLASLFRPNGPFALFIAFLTSCSYVLSLFSTFSCRFFYRICYDANGNQVSCGVDATFENEMNLDAYRYGLLSYLPSEYTNTTTWETCQWYPSKFQNEQTDSKFTLGRIFALFVLIFGGFATISMSLKLCITARRGQFLCDAVFLLLVSIFQGLSFIILASEFCIDPPNGNSDEFYPMCYIDTASYYSIASASGYFITSMLCIVYREFTPSTRERKIHRETEKIVAAQKATAKEQAAQARKNQKEAAKAEKERLAALQAAEKERIKLANANAEARENLDPEYQGVIGEHDEEKGAAASSSRTSRPSSRLSRQQQKSEGSIVSDFYEENKYDEDQQMQMHDIPTTRQNVAPNAT